MVNTVNTYTLDISPMLQNGYLSINLPNYISSQLTTHSLTINNLTSNTALLPGNTPNMVIPVDPSTNNIILTMNAITNPQDNQPNTFTLEQASDSSFTKVYARKAFSVSMNQFDPITVVTANRSATKVGISVNITLAITSPSYTDQMVINFPASQLFAQSNCSVTANGQTLPCSVINSTAILTTNLPSNVVYIISGLKN